MRRGEMKTETVQKQKQKVESVKENERYIVVIVKEIHGERQKKKKNEISTKEK